MWPTASLGQTTAERRRPAEDNGLGFGRTDAAGRLLLLLANVAGGRCWCLPWLSAEEHSKTRPDQRE